MQYLILGLNSGPSTYQAGPLPLEPSSQSFLLGSCIFFPEPAWTDILLVLPPIAGMTSLSHCALPYMFDFNPVALIIFLICPSFSRVYSPKY